MQVGSPRVCRCRVVYVTCAVALQRSYFDGLDDQILSNIVEKLGADLYLGPSPHPPAALVPVPKINSEAIPPEINSTPPLMAPCSPEDRSLSSGSHVYTHYPDAEAAKDCDASEAGSALQALACLNRRFRRLVYGQCSTCVCTVPTLISHAVRNMASHLTGLDLSHCGGTLHDHHCEPLRRLRGIRCLNLSNCCNLTGQALAYLSKASQLTKLDLSKCRYSSQRASLCTLDTIRCCFW